MMKHLIPLIILFLAAGTLEAQSWKIDLEDAAARHPKVLQASASLRMAEENLKQETSGRWAVPVGISGDILQDGQGTQAAAGISAGVNFPLGETRTQKLRRNRLELEVSTARRRFEDQKSLILVQGIQTYWTFLLDQSSLKTAQQARDLQIRNLERIQTLWDSGQASLTEWTSADQDLQAAEAALVRSRKAASLSRLAWYSFLGKPDDGASWTEMPQLKAEPPSLRVRAPETTAEWQEGEISLLTAGWEKDARQTDVPWNVRAALTGGLLSDQNLSLSYSGASAQGSAAYQVSPWKTDPSPAPSPLRWSLSLSLNPDLITWIAPDNSSLHLYSQAEAQWELTRQNLISQAESLRADWQAALSGLQSSQSSLKRKLTLLETVNLRRTSGRALPLDVETAALEVEKAQISLSQAGRDLFSAAAAAGIPPWELMEKEDTK